MNKITQIVDLLNSEVTKEKEKGKKLLANKDEEVKELQAANTELKTKYEQQIGDLIAKSKDIARTGDNAQATVNEMSGNFGLNAVWWGLKRFVFTSITAILIFVVVFLLLRIASATNPIAAAVFSVFNVIGSGILQLIKGLTPKAVEISKLVNVEEHNKYKETLDKVVDTIETFKLKCELGNKQCTLGEVLEELDRVMDQKDKDCIKDILKDQKWT
jgi:xanthosine utilization system XapX-like protein